MEETAADIISLVMEKSIIKGQIKQCQVVNHKANTYDTDNHVQKLEQGREEGIEQGLEQTAVRMLKAGKLSIEEISLYSGLAVEQVLKLKNEL